MWSPRLVALWLQRLKFGVVFGNQWTGAVGVRFSHSVPRDNVHALLPAPSSRSARHKVRENNGRRCGQKVRGGKRYDAGLRDRSDQHTVNRLTLPGTNVVINYLEMFS